MAAPAWGQIVNNGGGVGGQITQLPLLPAQGGVGNFTGASAYFRYLGDGSEGAKDCNGNLVGRHYYTTFTIQNGETCTSTGDPLVIRATGACTIAGTLTNSPITGGAGSGATATGDWGGSSAGSGAGAANGTAGKATQVTKTGNVQVLSGGGTAGTATGGNGGNGANGSSPAATGSAFAFRDFLEQGQQFCVGGAGGVQGGSSGTNGASGGGCIILACASINFTGTVDVRGGAATPVTGNSTGEGSAGAGGVAVLSTYNWIANTGSILYNSGPIVPNTAPSIELDPNDNTGTGGYVTLTGVTTGGLDASKATITGGTSYTVAPTCKVIVNGSGLTGSPACHVTISGGAINSFVVDTAGSGATFTAYTGAGLSGISGIGYGYTLTAQ